MKSALDVQNALKELFTDTLQSRPLQQIYAIVFLDAIHFKVNQDGQIVNKALHEVNDVNIALSLSNIMIRRDIGNAN